MNNVLKVAGVILVILAIMALLASLGIWAVNTLFGVAIAYTMENVFAATVLLLLVRSPEVSTKK